MTADAPHFAITINHIEECKDEPAADYVVIDAKDTEEMSCGFIVLDHPSDLLKLRAAIDAFIKLHNIQPLNTCYNGK